MQCLATTKTQFNQFSKMMDTIALKLKKIFMERKRDNTYVVGNVHLSRSVYKCAFYCISVFFSFFLH